MFFTLLAVTLAVSLATSFVVVRLFRKPIGIILSRIVSEEMASAWQRYVEFAIYVVGVSGGVRIGRLEQYITPGYDRTDPIVLNAERWTLEVYRTLIGTLQGIAWMLLVVFVVALIAYVLLRGFEMRRDKHQGDQLT